MIRLRKSKFKAIERLKKDIERTHGESAEKETAVNIDLEALARIASANRAFASDDEDDNTVFGDDCVYVDTTDELIKHGESVMGNVRKITE